MVGAIDVRTHFGKRWYDVDDESRKYKVYNGRKKKSMEGGEVKKELGTER